MPQRIEPPTHTLPTPSLPRIRWSVEQFENLFAMGLLPEKGYELIEGDVIEKMSVKETHSYVITLLFALFSRLVGFPLLRSQFSLWINETTLPEPDFALLMSKMPLLPHAAMCPRRMCV
jgi:Uma2 family endonuclease